MDRQRIRVNSITTIISLYERDRVLSTAISFRRVEAERRRSSAAYLAPPPPQATAKAETGMTVRLRRLRLLATMLSDRFDPASQNKIGIPRAIHETWAQQFPI